MALPKLSAQQPIVNPDRKPSSPFLQFMESTRTTQEATDARQDAVDATLTAQAATLATQQAALTAQQAQLTAQVAQIQALLGIAQSAAEAANDAQMTADEALAAGTVSGSATNPAVDVPDSMWVEGPVVSLTGVVAGNLTISGSGPIQDGDVVIDGAGIAAAGEFRIVEIDGVTETVLFTGEFSASQTPPGTTATITNEDALAVSNYSGALTTTGALDYRIDARCTFGSLTSLKLYIYARRAA